MTKNRHIVKRETSIEFVAHRREKDGEIQDLWSHLKETSNLTGQFASKIGLRKHGELVGLLHDLGKASEEFDQYIKSATGLIDPDADEFVNASEKKGKIDHSSAGAQIIYRYFTNKGNQSQWISQMLSLVIASHHSGLIDCLTADGEDNYSRRMNKSDKLTHTDECESNIDEGVKKELNMLLKNNFLVEQFNEKIKNLAESNDSYETRMFKVGLLTRFLFSCLIDADRINTADFEYPENKIYRNHGEYVNWNELIVKLEKHIDRLECKNRVDALRKEISDCCYKFSERPRGLYQLTVPTGGGKTLSSLRFALNHANKNKMDRVIYIIPYTSIIDQNADVARKILEDKTAEGEYLNNIVLEHHSNLTPEEENTRQKLLSENWDAPIVFTTMVQFLEGMFGKGTRNARRMHQLANSVIIFDEIQTLPVRCVHLFNVAIRFLVQSCGSTVVLCTATQPLLDRITPIQRALQVTPEQQMMKDVERLFKELKRVEVDDKQKIGGWTDEEIIELALKELLLTGSVLIIVNTKKSAQNLVQILKIYSTAKIAHLSTNMCPAHRLDVLDYIRKNLAEKNPIICVSTQLIEAGVDIDFGTVIRYVAGLDSISQAAGRCNRNGVRLIIGRVIIVNPKEENLDRLKDISKGKEICERVLGECKDYPEQFQNDILNPKTLERYYQYYFYKRSNEMNYQIDKKSKVGRTDNLFELLSRNGLSIDAYKRQNNNQNPQMLLCQSFKTAAEEFRAIDSITQGVIVPYEDEGNRIILELCSANDLGKQYKLLKKAQRYSVNIFSYMLEKLMAQKVIWEVKKGSGIYYLDKQYYSKDYGLSETPVYEMELLNC